jgi:hypothetical protein
MIYQLQHFGLVAGYAWMPLGFAGIDAADRRHDWRPLWKVAAASALCFLAGYPSTWVAFCVWMIAYACGRKGALRLATQVGGALAVSLLLAAVQLLPALEASQLKVPEQKFSGNSGLGDPSYFISYFLPNYFDFALDVPVEKNRGQDYVYLGAPAFTGLALLLIRKRFAALGPPLAVLPISLLFVINPFGSLAWIIGHSKTLTQVISTYYFLGGLTAAMALLAALGLDHGLKRAVKPIPGWLAATAVALSLGWSIHLIFSWFANRFAFGLWSGADALAAAVLFGLLIFVFTGSSRWFRSCTAAALLILAAAEYKAFGTSKRFNANHGRFTLEYVSNPCPGMNATTYAKLREHPEYRSAIDVTALSGAEFRHVGLTTPQGMDPFLPELYRAFADRIGHFRNNREFDLKPEDEETLRLLGVRFYITSAYGPLYSRISSNPHFERLLPDDSYYKVFELAGSRPSFGWENRDADHAVELKVWQPERRGFIVSSASGGHFGLTEQFYPGWKATIDGMETSIERCREVFQCIALPSGQHVVEFRYRSRWLLLGGAISLCSMLLLAKLVRV